MRIIQIHNHWKVEGGADRVFVDTAELLINKGHSVGCVSTDNIAKTSREAGNLIFSNPNYNNSHGLLGLFSRFKNYVYSEEFGNEFESYIEVNRPDIVHLHIIYGILSNSIIHVLKKHNIKTIMTVHDFKMLCPAYLFIDGQSNVCEKCAGGNYLHSIQKKCTRDSYLFSTVSALESTFRDKLYAYEETVDHFIFVSEFSRNKHLQYNSKFESKSSVLNNFTDPGKHLEVVGGKTEKYFYIGRLSREKGIQTLLDAFSEMPDIKLVLAGSGPLKSTVLDFAKRYSNINYLGFIETKDLIRVLLDAKFTILGSECYENNPMSIIESFSLGVPVIGANIGGIPEMVIHNGNGFLFEAGVVSSLKSAILSSRELSPTEYASMQNHSKRTFIEKYSLDAHYNNLISLYKHVIAG
jgi:glycosyltransferase involved in cell wall biosynthesis